MEFEKWLEGLFAEYKDKPGYDINIEALKRSNLRKAWNAGVESCIEILSEEGIGVYEHDKMKRLIAK